MIKYRVYDTDNKTYLDSLKTRILGNGDLVISSDEFGIEMVRTIAAEGIKDSGYVIEQYTNIYDKNGKEICEGDIIKAVITPYYGEPYDMYARIGRSKTGFAPISPSPIGDACLINFKWMDGESETVGSIHEDSELLRQNYPHPRIDELQQPKQQ